MIKSDRYNSIKTTSINMKKLLILSIITIFSISGRSQSIASKLGGSVSGILINSDYGTLPGFGLMLEHRLEFIDSNFELKNNIGAEFINNVNSKYAYHYIIKFGAMGEYNFLKFGLLSRYGNNWTPYLGIGGNLIYYYTSLYDRENPQTRTSYDKGITFSAKGSLGIKYKISPNTILHAEAAFDYSFSDNIDGRNIDSKDPLSTSVDHMAMMTIGLSYFL